MSFEGRGLVVGIDASNLRAGGGLTHLRELLEASDPARDGLRRIVVWGGTPTLNVLPKDRSWIELRHSRSLDGPLLARLWWSRRRLPRLVDRECDILLVPGGLRGYCRVPWVTMCRNMLPFECQERRRFGWSVARLRLEALRVLQSRAFSSAEGTIFLTEYARLRVQRKLRQAPRKSVVIPHGVSERFFRPAKCTNEGRCQSPPRRFRLLYVSTVNEYKHQWHVCEAASVLRLQGIDLELHLVGSGTRPALSRLRGVMGRLDPFGEWIEYHGSIPFEALHQQYHLANAFVFASSCENMPNILLEAMAATLPIACSNRGPMPEILGDSGFYFDPERPESIAQALEDMVRNPNRSKAAASQANEIARQYSWKKCASRTFAFLREVHGSTPH